MSYEQAPATKLLATHCACCARLLVDAKSVECGVGPECRKRHGFDVPVSEEARVEANRLVYRIALEQDGIGVLEACFRLRELGLEKLATRVEQRCVSIRIEQQDGDLVVVSPFNAAAVEAFRQIPGRRWDGAAKTNRVPLGARRQLWTLLQAFFPGHHGVGPRGPFVIEPLDRAA